MKLSEVSYKSDSRISRKCAKTVLEKVIQKIGDKKEQGKFSGKYSHGFSQIADSDKDSDLIIQQDSDEEDENLDALENATVDTLTSIIPLIHESLQDSNDSVEIRQ